MSCAGRGSLHSTNTSRSSDVSQSTVAARRRRRQRRRQRQGVGCKMGFGGARDDTRCALSRMRCAVSPLRRARLGSDLPRVARAPPRRASLPDSAESSRSNRARRESARRRLSQQAAASGPNGLREARRLARWGRADGRSDEAATRRPARLNLSVRTRASRATPIRQHSAM